MEKTKKSKKRKSLQITYPAPYSQSWNPDVLPVLMKNSVGRSSSLFQGTKRPKTPRAWSHTYSDRPDPTAPHLKYGVFRNRHGPPVPSIPLKSTPIPAKPNRRPPSPHVIQVPVERMRKQSANPAVKKHRTQKPSPQVLVIRNVDRSFSTSLSLSKVMHIDIKPKWVEPSPSYCPSPYFKTLPRKFAVSPAKLLFVKGEERE